ncbi:MW1434 family type I TA system toxin [Bacillus wiedmannii]|nr:MW1434 family type I TA system toxin [Bacillus wiedmannii]PEJ33631.1 hypothetical protein CN889_28130 [Bacillus wiedmannii]
MEFNEALVLLKSGKKITRESKRKPPFIALDGSDIMEKCGHPISGYGTYTPWKPTQVDILASEWVEA